MMQPIEVFRFENYRPDSYYIRRLDDAATLIERLRNSGLDHQVRFVANNPVYEGWWITLDDDEALSFFCLLVTIRTVIYRDST